MEKNCSTVKIGTLVKHLLEVAQSPLSQCPIPIFNRLPSFQVHDW